MPFGHERKLFSCVTTGTRTLVDRFTAHLSCHQTMVTECLAGFGPA
jgi:hypothetical protein